LYKVPLEKGLEEMREAERHRDTTEEEDREKKRKKEKGGEERKRRKNYHSNHINGGCARTR